jgi:hypothetical protein
VCGVGGETMLLWGIEEQVSENEFVVSSERVRSEFVDSGAAPSVCEPLIVDGEGRTAVRYQYKTTLSDVTTFSTSSH